MVADRSFWQGRRVLITGHTGFKGAWLCAWLARMGARVTGLALPPGSDQRLFDRIGVERMVRSCFGDVRDADVVRNALRGCSPEIVFHLAAQPLVLESVRDPLGTFATNALGTVHLLEAIRVTPSVRAAVIVTSDKCYRDGAEACIEDDALGGTDPYSASKACAEIAVAAWRSSFLQSQRGIGVASARAGNVIGGGDFAADRLIPDLVRGAGADRKVKLRYPAAIRPWQHVLDALSGYLRLAEALVRQPAEYARSWNFGPAGAATWTVAELTEAVLSELGGGTWERAGDGIGHEAPVLRLSSTRARHQLGWEPQLDIGAAVRWTVAGYRALADGPGCDWLHAQIDSYEELRPNDQPRRHVEQKVLAHA